LHDEPAGDGVLMGLNHEVGTRLRICLTA